MLTVLMTAGDDSLPREVTVVPFFEPASTSTSEDGVRCVRPTLTSDNLSGVLLTSIRTSDFLVDETRSLPFVACDVLRRLSRWLSVDPGPDEPTVL